MLPLLFESRVVLVTLCTAPTTAAVRVAVRIFLPLRVYDSIWSCLLAIYPPLRPSPSPGTSDLPLCTHRLSYIINLNFVVLLFSGPWISQESTLPISRFSENLRQVTKHLRRSLVVAGGCSTTTSTKPGGVTLYGIRSLAVFRPLPCFPLPSAARPLGACAHCLFYHIPVVSYSTFMDPERPQRAAFNRSPNRALELYNVPVSGIRLVASTAAVGHRMLLEISTPTARTLLQLYWSWYLLIVVDTVELFICTVGNIDLFRRVLLLCRARSSSSRAIQRTRRQCIHTPRAPPTN